MRWCFGDGKRTDLAYAEKTMDVLTTGSALVPTIWGLEVANVLTRAEHHGYIDTAHSTKFLAALNALRIVTDTSSAEHALTDTLHLARRFRLSAYDAAYLELAQRKGFTLATLHADLRKAAGKAGVPVFQ